MPTFSAPSFFFSSSLQSSSRFTFIHAHKCTHKTHSIALNNAQRHEHVLIRSSTYFTKSRDSAEYFGRRGSTASISDSWSCAIGNERKRRSHLYSKRCSRASAENEREIDANGHARQKSTGYESLLSRVRCGALENERAESGRRSRKSRGVATTSCRDEKAL